MGYTPISPFRTSGITTDNDPGIIYRHIVATRKPGRTQVPDLQNLSLMGNHYSVRELVVSPFNFPYPMCYDVTCIVYINGQALAWDIGN